MSNRFGLSRAIPDPVRRLVRQRCGYGCVVCGAAIIDYEHFEPEFIDTPKHDPDGITLLCPTCHAKKTRGFLSKARIAEANAQPAALSAGFAFSELERTHKLPFVRFAGSLLRNCPTPVEVCGFPVLKIAAAETPNGPYRLSGTFFGRDARPSLQIIDNEWRVFTEAWDVETSGGVVTVRPAAGEIALRLRFDPGEGVVVERLQMLCAGYNLDGDSTVLHVTGPDGKRRTLRGNLVDNCKVGLRFGKPEQ